MYRDSQWEFLYDSGNSNLGCTKTKRDGNRWEMGRRFKEEIYVHLWLMHVDV